MPRCAHWRSNGSACCSAAGRQIPPTMKPPTLKPSAAATPRCWLTSRSRRKCVNNLSPYYKKRTLTMLDTPTQISAVLGSAGSSLTDEDATSFPARPWLAVGYRYYVDTSVLRVRGALSGAERFRSCRNHQSVTSSRANGWRLVRVPGAMPGRAAFAVGCRGSFRGGLAMPTEAVAVVAHCRRWPPTSRHRHPRAPFVEPEPRRKRRASWIGVTLLSALWTRFNIVPAPIADDAIPVGKRQEPVQINELLAQAAVRRLDQRIVCWLSWRVE